MRAYCLSPFQLQDLGLLFGFDAIEGLEQLEHRPKKPDRKRDAYHAALDECRCSYARYQGLKLRPSKRHRKRDN